MDRITAHRLSRHLVLGCLVAASMFAWFSEASAQAPGDQPSMDVATAERMLLDGDHEAAVAAYQQLDTAVLPASALHNYGIALYRVGNLTEAAEQFQAAAAATNDSLAASARFNLGNCHYALALSALQSQEAPDPDAAIEQLMMAINAYRSSLRLAPSDTDARANIELASKLIAEIEEEKEEEQPVEERQEKEQGEEEEKQSGEQQQQSEQQQSEQQQSEQQQSEQQQSEQQQSEQQQSEQQQSEQQQSEQQQSEQQQSEQQQSEQQQSEQQQSEQQQSEQQQSDGQTDSNSASDDQPSENTPPGENQSTPDNEQSSGDSSEASEQDDRESGVKEQGAEEQGAEEQGAEEQGEADDAPMGELKAANLDDGETDQEAGQRAAAQQAMRMTDEEARKMLQAIRDRDMLRRLRKQAAERSRRIPVERDW